MHTQHRTALVLSSTDPFIQNAFCDENYNHAHAFSAIEAFVNYARTRGTIELENDDMHLLANSYTSIYYDPYSAMDYDHEFNQFYSDLMVLFCQLKERLIRPLYSNDINGLFCELYPGGHQMMIVSF